MPRPSPRLMSPPLPRRLLYPAPLPRRPLCPVLAPPTELQPGARLWALRLPRHAFPRGSRRPGPDSTSASEDFGARRFRERRVELVLTAFGMAACSGPAAPILSLNPQEDVEYQKEVAQVRKRVTQRKKRELTPGVVYVRHLPNLLDETQIFSYFSQFGTVTRFRLSRSKRVRFL
ncbi:uncharacterized protein LOC108297945 [Cebus imitator]|uniref:uncharacterized protein LOC108297945 n=1 Tax=Cebus imitator TaxID=2715852 RepID=UPI000809A172|nr:uncharacterized protein LOC108297945 [Cebus imitator]